MKKRWLPLTLALLTLVSATALAEIAVPQPDSDLFYVYDGANVLSLETEAQIYYNNVNLYNACGAELMGLGRLIMGAEDVLKVCEAAPDATIIASHMDAVNHATVSRAGLREFLNEHGKGERILIPEDGEIMEFPGK